MASDKIKRYLAQFIAIVAIIVVFFAIGAFAGNMMDSSVTNNFTGRNEFLSSWVNKIPGIAGVSISPYGLLVYAALALALGAFIDSDATAEVVEKAADGVVEVVGEIAEGAGQLVSGIFGGVVSGLAPLLPWIIGGLIAWGILRKKNETQQQNPVIITGGKIS
jgi:uncharacterized membrane protein